MEAEAENENPSRPNRCHMDGVGKTNIIEWNKKRKLETDQLDLPRPKHRCWASRLISSEHGPNSDHNIEFASMNKLMVKTETFASALDDDDKISEPKSSSGSNSFGEDSDTAISVNAEAKLQTDSAKPHHFDDDDNRQALMNLQEQSLALGILTDHAYSSEKEFEDGFTTYGANPNLYILSSGRWNVNKEAESNTRPPTIDQEFEQYFSMLML